MRSFRFKLVLYFALIALVPVATAFYAFDELTRRAKVQRVDARLHAALRSSVAAYAQRVEQAEGLARSLARSQALRRALRAEDPREAARIAAEWNAAVVGTRAVPNRGETRSAPVEDGERVLGRVVVRIPFDGAMLQRIRSGLDPRDRLVAVRDGFVVAGPFRGEPLYVPPGAPARVEVGGEAYRALATSELLAPAGVELVALAPQREIDAAAASSRRRIALALGGALAALGLVTYLAGRSVVRRLGRLVEGADAVARGRLETRVDVRGHDELAQVGEAFNRMAAQLEQRRLELANERRRAREATVRFGEALAATHDPQLLLRVIVETVVEAIGAAGGVVVSEGRVLARAGDPDAAGERLELPLELGEESFGTAVLTGSGFDEEQRARARSLVSQAAVALDNARLHRIVEQQALVDPLTGLANRRALEESLRAEFVRAQRLGTELCLVLADLDGFKALNDRHGHPFGDFVLREFARTLSGVARAVDVPGRWGGEEFALIAPGADVAGGAALAERVRSALAERRLRSPGGRPIRLTASFGVAAYPACADLETLVAQADDALYRAKRSGRDRVVVAAGAARR